MPEGSEKKLTAKQERALRSLLDGQSFADAARDCGVTPRTLFRWLQDATFAARLRDLQGRALDEAMLNLQTASTRAVATLIKNLSNENAFASNAAAVAILGNALKWRDTSDLQDRLEQLERTIAELEQGRKVKRWRA
jgi:transposase-like protein